MAKEICISSTPHETRLAILEDDQLAEIYYERENEYTLAGSIYNGRVTRVLPGMQSAFVDIGLERDAFLYVSDFMELEDSDEVDELPAGPIAAEPRYRPRVEAQPAAREPSPSDGSPEVYAEAHGENRAEAPSQPLQNRESSGPEREGENEDRGGYRGRRRRRGGRRGERMPESKFAHPASSEATPAAPRESARNAPPERTERPERGGRPERAERNDRNERSDRSEHSDYGPPPGYQPIILPGESISKYQRLAQTRPPVPSRQPEPIPSPSEASETLAPVAKTFPNDEPLFTGLPLTGLPSEPPSAFAEPAARDQDEIREQARVDWGRVPERLDLVNTDP